MKKELSETEKADLFWKWFCENQNNYLQVNQKEGQEREQLLNMFLEKLHRYHPHLFFEMGGRSDTESELIITAEGIKDYFPAVELLVSRAPRLKGWNIIAFKPPMGTEFRIEIGGHQFEPGKIIFIPLDNKEQPSAVGIQVCYPQYTEENKNIFIQGTYLILDVILGEKSTTLDIDYLDITQTPPNLSDYPYRHLSGIREYIEEKKRMIN
ncbi:MAG: hypothetical protein AB1458_09590 [Bacteroidota bacterium]